MSVEGLSLGDAIGEAVKVVMSEPSSTFQIFTVPSKDPEASFCDEEPIAKTGAVWPE